MTHKSRPIPFPLRIPALLLIICHFFPSATSFLLDAVNGGGWLHSIQCLVCQAAIYSPNTVISHSIICHKAPFQLWNPKSLSWCKAHPKGMNGLTEAIGMEIFVQSPTPKASLCQHKCQCMYSYWAWLTELSPSPQWAKCIACCILICHSPGLFDSVRRPRKEEDLVSEARHLLTRKKPACTQIPPVFQSMRLLYRTHTKVPIKGHYGFSTSSNHRQSSSQPIHCGHADVSRVVVQRNSDSSANFRIIITDED